MVFFALAEFTLGAATWIVKKTVGGVYYYFYPVKTAEDYEMEILNSINEMKKENQELREILLELKNSNEKLKGNTYEIVAPKEIQICILKSAG